MSRVFAIAVLLLTTLAVTAPAEANWFKTAWHSFWLDYRRNAVWPEPFVQPDREAVRAPFAVMVAKGWRMQNTLDDHHFEGNGGVLNEAGRLKVKAILDITPPEHKAVFVLRGVNPQQTAARIDSVQEVVVGMMPSGSLPPVLETHTAPAGWSGMTVYTIDAKYRASTPDPRLPEADSSGNEQ